MTVHQYLEKLKTLDVVQITFDILKDYEEELVNTQKDQLWAGQDVNGNDLSPSIFDDPYFTERAGEINRHRTKTKVTPFELAQKWSDFKDRQTQWMDSNVFGKRKKGVPNLIYTSGVMIWEQLYVSYQNYEVYIMMNDKTFLAELEAKYGEIFGLNPVGANHFADTFFLSVFFNRIENHFK